MGLRADADARKVAQFVQGLPGLQIETCVRQSYQHMGATIGDAVLQAGLNYRTVVEPRVKRIMTLYPEARTTSGFLDVIGLHGLQRILNWRHPEKPRRVLRMVFLLRDEGVDTEGDLRAWLQDDRSMRLLRALKGIGPKTIDYLKMLAGLPAIPVDRHVRLFAQCAGVTCTDYADLRTVLERASDFLGVACSSLDYAIWSYVSAGNSLSPPAAA